jgi:glycosyltransferase involved in cell wall biosynthesis
LILQTKVLQLIGSFHTGGSERQAVQLSRLLAESGECGVFVAVLEASGALRTEIEKLNLSAIPEFPLTSFYDRNFVRQTRRAAWFLRENQIEIIHTHDFYTNVFGMLAAQIAGIKAKIASKRETGEMRGAMQQIVEKQAFWLAKKIVVNAVAVRDFLEEQGVCRAKIEVVYNGLDLTRLQPTQSRAETLREFDLPENGKIVVLVANLRHKVKNQKMFLRSAQIVKRRFENVAFVLAGEGELMSQYKRLAADLGIEQHVFFLGSCAKIADLLSVCDVGVLSSLAEGFSNSILEYMAARLPVVATKVGGADEAVADGASGFLVDSNDETAMAEKILFLLEHTEIARQFGERGRKIIEQKFSCQSQLEQTLKIYEQVLRN